MFKEINIKKLEGNVFKMLDNDWMLITAGNKKSFNTMTASWGGFGILWNLPVSYIFVRPQRYTFQFTEDNAYFTLCFFNEESRNILKYCGSRSGRNSDKIKDTGLLPEFTTMGNVFFNQARLVIECKKLYSDLIKEDHFHEMNILSDIYRNKDYHTMYIGEILHTYIKE